MAINFKPDRSILSAVPLFAGLEPSACDDALAQASVVRVARGDAVFEQGDAADAFFVLAEGCLKAVQGTSSGHQIIIHFVNPGEFFGCVALMGAKHYPATALAVKDSIALSWSVSAIGGLIERHQLISKNALAGFGGRMMEVHSRLREIHTEKVAQRIAHALLQVIDRSGCSTEAGVKVDFPITRQDVAEIAGTTLFTVSRTLSKWEKAGILKSERQKIVVVDAGRLLSIAEETDCD